jgi:hypothetical protein
VKTFKNLTASQKQLVEISREPISGFQLDIVELHQDYSGVSTALRAIRRGGWAGSGPRNIILEASRPWDVVMALVNIAGRNTYGNGYLDTCWKALSALSGDARSPLCLWFEDARHMKPAEREMLVCLIEWIHEQLNIPVRIVMLIGKTRVWDFSERKRVAKFVHSARLDARARKFEFTREGLDEVEREAGAEAEPLRKIG